MLARAGWYNAMPSTACVANPKSLSPPPPTPHPCSPRSLVRGGGLRPGRHDLHARPAQLFRLRRAGRAARLFAASHRVCGAAGAGHAAPGAGPLRLLALAQVRGCCRVAGRCSSVHRPKASLCCFAKGATGCLVLPPHCSCCMPSVPSATLLLCCRAPSSAERAAPRCTTATLRRCTAAARARRCWAATRPMALMRRGRRWRRPLAMLSMPTNQVCMGRGLSVGVCARQSCDFFA